MALGGAAWRNETRAWRRAMLKKPRPNTASDVLAINKNNLNFTLNSQCNRRLTWSPKNVDSTNQKQLPGNSMSIQLKNLTIFNFAQILHANSHPQEKQLCQIFEKSVKYFSSYAQVLPQKSGLTAMSRQSFINNSSNN